MPCPTSFVVKNGSKTLPCRSSGTPGPIVTDFEHERAAIGIVRGAHDDRALAVGAEAGLLGVDQQIEQDLLDLMAVGKHIGHAGGERLDDLMFETFCS